MIQCVIMPVGAFRQFDILAHFKFEVGASQVKLSKLQNSLERIRTTTDNIEKQFKTLFAHHSLALTGGTAGVVGTIHKMVTASEDYYQLQRKISTIMVANTKNQINFNSAMQTSSVIMKSLSQDANKFAFPIQDYTDVFSMLAGPMASKGVAGPNFQKTRELSRNFMMMRNVFDNFNPWEIHSVLSGNITNDNPLWAVLRDDTEAFRGMSLGKWRNMKYGKKIDLLNKGFSQYSEDNPDIIESYKNSLSGQLTILSNNFTSITSVLKDLGDVLRRPLLELLKTVNNWIQEKLSVSLKYLSNTVKPLTQDLERLYIEFDKLNTLSSSVSKSNIASTIAFFLFEMGRFMKIISKVGMSVGLLSVKTGALLAGGFFALLKWITKTDTALKAIIVSFNFLVKSLFSYLKFFAVFQTIFRVIDSAMAQAKLSDLKKYANELPEITKKTTEIMRVLAAFQFPISAFINFLGKQISFLFQKTWWLEKIYNLIKNIDMEGLARSFSHAMIQIYTVLEQIVLGILNMFKNPIQNLWKEKQPFTKLFENIFEGIYENYYARKLKFDQHYDKYVKDATTKPPPVYQNYGKIEIKNQFRENMQPERVAVALRDVLGKSVQSRIDTDRRAQNFTPGTGSAYGN